MAYVVYGATGAQGGAVVAALTAVGKTVDGISRRAGAPLRAGTAVTADNGSVESLVQAYARAEGVFVHLPLAPAGERLRYARNVVVALTETRPSRIIVSTSGGAFDEAASNWDADSDDALPALVGGVARAGLSHAVVAARLFLDNLLLPPVATRVRSEGVLGYPIRADFPVSWASHLDVADAAAALFDRVDVTGVVAVGQLPAITGPDLVEAFGARLRRQVSFEALTPEAFANLIAPIIGEGSAAGVRAIYGALAQRPEYSIEATRSAQHRLGLAPRTSRRWLEEMGV